MDESGGRLLSDHLRELLIANLERENAIYRWMRDHEPWESRLKREVWRRSLRGRWFFLRYRLSQRSMPIRARIAHAIYPFHEED